MIILGTAAGNLQMVLSVGQMLGPLVFLAMYTNLGPAYSTSCMLVTGMCSQLCATYTVHVEAMELGTKTPVLKLNSSSIVPVGSATDNPVTSVAGLHEEEQKSAFIRRASYSQHTYDKFNDIDIVT